MTEYYFSGIRKTSGREILKLGGTENNTILEATAKSALTKFQPVYAEDTGLSPAVASTYARSNVVGFSLETVAAAATVVIQTDGTIEGTVAEWAAISGNAGGLVFGENYYLDPNNEGQILTASQWASSNSPLTGYRIQVGTAMSATVLAVLISEPQKISEQIALMTLAGVALGTQSGISLGLVN